MTVKFNGVRSPESCSASFLGRSRNRIPIVDSWTLGFGLRTLDFLLCPLFNVLADFFAEAQQGCLPAVVEVERVEPVEAQRFGRNFG